MTGGNCHFLHSNDDFLPNLVPIINFKNFEITQIAQIIQKEKFNTVTLCQCHNKPLNSQEIVFVCPFCMAIHCDKKHTESCRVCQINSD